MPLTTRQVAIQARRLTREGQAAHLRNLEARQAQGHYPGTCSPLCPACEALLPGPTTGYSAALAALQAAVASADPARIFSARGEAQRLAPDRATARRDIAAITEAP